MSCATPLNAIIRLPAGLMETSDLDHWARRDTGSSVGYQE